MTAHIARKIPIVADTRETRSGVIERLRRDDRFEVEVRPLRIGDYWIDDEIAIERKALQDFYRFIFSKKIFRQVGQLRRASARCVLLVEGLGMSPPFQSLPPWLTGALLAITAGYQVPLLPTRDRSHTAETLYLLALQQAREGAGIPHEPKLHARASVDHWLRHRALQALPGVGPKRAAALLDRFGTLGPIFTADRDALLEVHGVGRDTARTVLRLGQGLC